MLHVRVDVPPVPECIEALAEGVVLLNMSLMRYADEHGDVELPSLYDTTVVYRREPVGREWWETAVDVRGVVTDRSGDCEDLANYQAAWLRYHCGEPARTRIVVNRRGNFHAILERGDGSTEDPSYIMLALESERTGVPIVELSKRTTSDRRYT